jgi:hypothetical protein
MLQTKHYPDVVPILFVLAKIREVLVEPCDGRLCRFRVDLVEQRPASLPLGGFVVLIVFARLVGAGTVLVVPADVVIELAMNVEVMFQSLRYLWCRMGTVAVTVIHRCIWIRSVLS